MKKDTFHYKWSKKHPPVLSVKPGAKVRFEVNEVTSWQVTQHSVASELLKIDEQKLYPLAGPVYVEGAMPGDALVVKLEEIKPAAWGWTGIMPGLGLLASEFPDPELYIWKLAGTRNYATFRQGIQVPLAPFCGVLGVAPAEEGYFEVLPPGKHGGNMDIRHLTAGSTLWLPVYTEGALFSVCDLHAAQGDGEVCVTAIECPGQVTVSLELQKGAQLPGPCYHNAGSRAKEEGFFATTGIGPKLIEASKDAVRHMISYLMAEKGLSRGEAYMLCSVAGDLRIHEVVDSPNWVVGMCLADSILRRGAPKKKKAGK